MVPVLRVELARMHAEHLIMAPQAASNELELNSQQESHIFESRRRSDERGGNPSFFRNVPARRAGGRAN
jgi:hypothetical protein